MKSWSPFDKTRLDFGLPKRKCTFFKRNEKLELFRLLCAGAIDSEQSRKRLVSFNWAESV